jgi:hypothetical protein
VRPLEVASPGVVGVVDSLPTLLPRRVPDREGAVRPAMWTLPAHSLWIFLTDSRAWPDMAPRRRGRRTDQRTVVTTGLRQVGFRGCAQDWTQSQFSTSPTSTTEQATRSMSAATRSLSASRRDRSEQGGSSVRAVCDASHNAVQSSMTAPPVPLFEPTEPHLIGHGLLGAVVNHLSVGVDGASSTGSPVSQARLFRAVAAGRSAFFRLRRNSSRSSGAVLARCCPTGSRCSRHVWKKVYPAEINSSAGAGGGEPTRRRDLTCDYFEVISLSE